MGVGAAMGVGVAVAFGRGVGDGPAVGVSKGGGRGVEVGKTPGVHEQRTRLLQFHPPPTLVHDASLVLL